MALMVRRVLANSSARLLTQPDHAMLRGDIRRGIGAALQPRDRGDDDQALVLSVALEQVGQRELGAVEHGGEIGGDDRVEGFAFGAQEGRAVADAGVEDDIIERAVGVAGGGKGGFHRGAIGEVAGDCGAAGFGRDGVERFAAAAEQGELGALGGEHARCGGADAGAAAGDQCVFSRRKAHSTSPF